MVTQRWEREIYAIAQKFWSAITPQYFQMLYKQLSTQMSAIVELGGAYTEY